MAKTLIVKFQKDLPVLISPEQTAYVNGKFTGKSGRLVLDIIEVCVIEKSSGYLMTIDF